MKTKKTVHNKKKRRKFLIIIAGIILIIGIWKVLRITSSVSFKMDQEIPDVSYSENDRVMKAISLSYFVYGCETCDHLSGTIREILQHNRMGILEENDGVRRIDKLDSASAVFDTSTFIKNYVGDYRFLTDLKDKKSGFYGAAFCDDENKCVWITYSGSVTSEDYVACAQIVLNPGLSAQEKLAFRLMENVMKSDEVQKESYSVILTGHSLGGTLASMVSYMSGCVAVTINGADGLAIDKLNDIVGEPPSGYRISNYMTAKKKGKRSFKDFVQTLMFLGSYKTVDYHVYPKNSYTTDSHCAFSFIEFPNDDFTNPILP